MVKIKVKKPLKKSLILSDGRLRQIYAQTYFPDYPRDSLMKMTKEVFIESDKIAVREQAKVLVEWIKKRGVETDGAFTVKLSVKDTDFLNSILEM